MAKPCEFASSKTDIPRYADEFTIGCKENTWGETSNESIHPWFQEKLVYWNTRKESTSMYVGSMLYNNTSSIMRNGTHILDERMLWIGEFIDNSTEEYHWSSSTSPQRISHSHLVPLENHNWSSLLAWIDRFFDLVSKEYSFSRLNDQVARYR